jgi:hypothetical protein
MPAPADNPTGRGRLGSIAYALSLLFAAHESVCGTKLSIANVRSTAAFRGKADSICSVRIFPVVTTTGHASARGEHALAGFELGGA